MMDAKYLEEIKAREQAATPGPWQSNKSSWGVLMLFDRTGRALLGGTEGTANAAFIAHARTDIPALLAEVERLTARLQESPYGDDKIDELEEACDNLRFQIGSKDQQIATLKKALELMHADAESSIGSFMPDVDEFIQQAQEQEEKK